MYMCNKDRGDYSLKVTGISSPRKELSLASLKKILHMANTDEQFTILQT